jgi:hypothetical protein
LEVKGAEVIGTEHGQQLYCNDDCGSALLTGLMSRQSSLFAMTVSVPLTATIAVIVSLSLIATVHLFVNSCRSGLHSTELFTNCLSPLLGPFDFLDCLLTGHPLSAWVGPAVYNALIRHLVSDCWHGLGFLVRFEGQGGYA